MSVSICFKHCYHTMYFTNTKDEYVTIILAFILCGYGWYSQSEGRT